MTPIKYALVWVVEYVIFMAVLACGFTFFPERLLYDALASHLGVIQGDNWDNFYFLFLSALSVIITGAIIFITAFVRQRTRH